MKSTQHTVGTCLKRRDGSTDETFVLLGVVPSPIVYLLGHRPGEGHDEYAVLSCEQSRGTPRGVIVVPAEHLDGDYVNAFRPEVLS